MCTALTSVGGARPSEDWASASPWLKLTDSFATIAKGLWFGEKPKKQHFQDMDVTQVELNP